MEGRAWILVGMMGSGKSTVGRILAAKSGRAFQDTDQLIVQRLGRPIHQLFSIYGQDAFRDHETAILKSIEPSASVLATGGGIVLRPANWVEMARIGLVIHLDASIDLLIERLEKSAKRRPLLEVENWEQRVRDLFAERRSLYLQADLSVPIEDEDLEAAADKVLLAIAERT